MSSCWACLEAESPLQPKVAEQLGAQLDVILVRKLGVPFPAELAMGAVGEGGILILDHHTIRRARVTEAQLVAAQERERAELQRRPDRPGRPSVALAGRTAVIVDDGLATGSTAQAACQVARAHDAQNGGARRAGSPARLGTTNLPSGRRRSGVRGQSPPFQLDRVQLPRLPADQ